MKKTLIALAALAVVSAASAQSTVTMYGVVDMGVAQLKDSTLNNGTYVKNGVQQGTMSNSRIGFKGTEDLGNGLKANFVLEYAVNPDEKLTTMDNRLGTVGLSGNFGAVTIGRQYSPYYVVQGAMDLLGNLNATPGYVVNNHIVDGGRVSNSVQYASPSFGGFSAIAQVGAGSSGGGTESINGVAAGKSFGLAGIYAAGPLVAGFGYNDVTNPSTTLSGMSTITGATPYVTSAVGVTPVTSTATLAGFGSGATGLGTFASKEVKVWAAGASYDFSVVKASLAYSSLTDQKVANQDLTSKGWNASISAPLGAVTLAANLGRANVNQADLNIDGTITGFQLMANYSLSKRTTAYAVAGRDKTEAFGAEQLVRTSTAVGVRHTF